MLMKTRGSLTFEISMPDYIASWKRVAVPISIPIGMRAPSYFLRSLSRFLESFATIYLNRSKLPLSTQIGRWKIARVRWSRKKIDKDAHRKDTRQRFFLLGSSVRRNRLTSRFDRSKESRVGQILRLENNDGYSKWNDRLFI